MKTIFQQICWCLIVWQQGYGQDLGKSQASSYFFMKQNGGYEYAFNTDTGMQSAQTADQANEVTGHYMYYEKGVPFMVKYRAGVNGYQPEIIPVEKLMGESFNDRKMHNYVAADNSLAGRDLRVTSLQESHTNNYHLNASPKVSSFNIGADTTLNFVQNALKIMQNQPMHMSFNSESGQVQHTPSHYTTTIRPTVSTILQPVSRNEVQDINNLSLMPAGSLADNKHSYSFNYNADRSTRSETSDNSGNVVGSYSYFDEPGGYHDIAYKNNDNSDFVVLGGNLAHNQLSSPSSSLSSPLASHQTQRRQLFRSNNFNFNNYRTTPDTRLTANALVERNLGKRSLRKFRRYAKW